MSEEESTLKIPGQHQQNEINNRKLELLGVSQTLQMTTNVPTTNTPQQFSDINQEVKSMLQNSSRKLEIHYQDSSGNNSFQNMTNHVITKAGRQVLSAPVNSLSDYKPNILTSPQHQPIVRTNIRSNQSNRTTVLSNHYPVQVPSISTNQNQHLDSNGIPINKITTKNVVLQGGGKFEEGQAYIIHDKYGNTRKTIWKNGEFQPMVEEQIQHSAKDSSRRGRGRGSRGRSRERSNLLRNTTNHDTIQPSDTVGSPTAKNVLRQLQTTSITNHSSPMLNQPDLRQQVVSSSNQGIKAMTPNTIVRHSGDQGPLLASVTQSTAIVQRKPLLNKTTLKELMPMARITQKFGSAETVQPGSAAQVEDKQANVHKSQQSNISTDAIDAEDNPGLPNIPPDPNAVAVCQYCGYTSVNKLKCDGCKTKFTNTMKYVIKVNSNKQDLDSKRRKLDFGSATVTGSVLDKNTFYGNKFREDKFKEQYQVYMNTFNAVNSSRPNTVRILSNVTIRRRGHGRGRGYGVHVPVTVTISSDEEEGVSEDKTMYYSFSAPSTPQSGQSRSPSHADSASDCPESPVIPNTPINKHIISRGIDKLEDAKCSTSRVREMSLSPVEMRLNARSVLVGSFRGVPVEPILIAKNGLSFFIEGVSGTYTFNIYPQEILQCLANLDVPRSLIFFLITQGCAVRTRKDLNIPTHINPIQPLPEPYFDPLASNMCHQMIIIVLDQVDQRTKLDFYKYLDMFKSWGKQGDDGFFMELSASEADDILQQSTQKPYPVQPSVVIMSGAPNQVYSQQGEDDRQSHSPSPTQIGFAGPVIKLLTYPPPPQKGGITITNEDLYCLQEGEFLNDVIVDFYLKYLLLEKLSLEDRSRTHIFSSFFYRRLTQRIQGAAIDDDPCLNLPQKRHARVKTWTRHVDIFKKEFIVIPINEHAHWFLAIVCFPGLENLIENPFIPKLVSNPVLESANISTPPQPTDDNTGDMEAGESQDDLTDITDITQPSFTQETVSHDTNKDSVSSDSKLQTGTEDETEAKEDQSVENSSSELTDQATEKQSSADADKELEQTSGSAEAADNENVDLENKDAKSVTSKETITKIVECSKGILGKAIAKSDSLPEDAVLGFKQPCILIFDSLSGPPRNHIVQVLKDYLQVEWTVKRPGTELNKALFKGCLPKIPQQNNFSDCGLFMLQYVESFFEDPIQDFSIPMKGLHDWFSTQRVDGKREEIRDLIIGLKEKQESEMIGNEKV